MHGENVASNKTISVNDSTVFSLYLYRLKDFFARHFYFRYINPCPQKPLSKDISINYDEARFTARGLLDPRDPLTFHLSRARGHGAREYAAVLCFRSAGINESPANRQEDEIAFTASESLAGPPMSRDVTGGNYIAVYLQGVSSFSNELPFWRCSLHV